MNSRGSPLPAEEWTLCLFATWLADDLKAASIKVYLSAVRALHIEQGFPDPLSGCLRLQRVLKGIKRCQGSSSDKRLPVTRQSSVLSTVISISHSMMTLCFGRLAV
jgi:hypothetical protein